MQYLEGDDFLRWGTLVSDTEVRFLDGKIRPVTVPPHIPPSELREGEEGCWLVQPNNTPQWVVGGLLTNDLGLDFKATYRRLPNEFEGTPQLETRGGFSNAWRGFSSTPITFTRRGETAKLPTQVRVNTSQLRPKTTFGYQWFVNGESLTDVVDELTLKERHLGMLFVRVVGVHEGLAYISDTPTVEVTPHKNQE